MLPRFCVGRRLRLSVRRRCVVVVFWRSGDVGGDGGASDERHAHRSGLGGEPGDLRHPQSGSWVRTIKILICSPAVSSSVFILLFYCWFHFYQDLWGTTQTIELFSWDDLELLGRWICGSSSLMSMCQSSVHHVRNSECWVLNCSILSQWFFIQPRRVLHLIHSCGSSGVMLCSSVCKKTKPRIDFILCTCQCHFYRLKPKTSGVQMLQSIRIVGFRVSFFFEVEYNSSLCL